MKLAVGMAGLFLAWLLAVTVVHGDTGGASTYPLRGILRGVDAKTGQVTVSHDEVRGYMAAMTMDFDVANADELRALRPGDTFTAQLWVSKEHAVLAQVRKENAPGAAPLPAALPARRSTELDIGDALPDVALVNQRGETVHLRDFGGKPLAISFVYLRCPLPTYCPLLNRHFAAAQDLLERLGAKGQARFLSVSMDPEHDTPARLAEYADALDADGRTWTFASAREDALRQLGGAVGLEFQRQGDAINHNLRTVVVDGRGRIRHVFRGNAWTPQELAAELRAALRAE